MGDTGRDERLREAAANRGLKLVKSRIRTPGKGDYGHFGLTDPSGAKLLGFGKSGLTATAEAIEEYLHQSGASDWQGSLRAAGAKPPARSKGRAAPPPKRESKAEPEPEPPAPAPLSVRPAKPSDSEAVAGLIAGLGFAASADEIAARLSVLKKSREAPWVAEQGEVIGVLAWHITPVLHRPKPVGRITMMTVADGERRRGVGRALVEAACEAMRAKGCGLIEVTSNIDLSNAHGFYRKLGFERTSYRFAKTL